MPGESSPIEVFFSYAHKDESMRDELATQLTVLERQGVIKVWHDRALVPGEDFDAKIKARLASAGIILLLLSPDFLASKYITTVEVEVALARRANSRIMVIPVILRPCQWRDTELASLQALPKDGRPITDWPSRDSAWLEVAQGIRKAALEANAKEHREPAWPEGQPASNDSAQQIRPIQNFRTSLAPGWSCFLEDGKVAWLVDGKQVELFRLGSSETIDRWFLPDFRWKCCLAVIWQGNLVCSDWDGSLWLFNGKTRGRGEALYSAHYDDLPIHLLAMGSRRELVAATWAGGVMSWDAQGHPLLQLPPRTLPYLPLKILPGPGDGVTVFDQSGRLRLLDAKGKELWTWRAEGRVSEIWHDGAEEGRCAFFLLSDERRVTKITVGDSAAETVLFDAPVRHVSHLLRQPGEGESVIAVAGKGLEWLSWLPFRIATLPGAPHSFEVRHSAGLFDPQRRAARIALALDECGRLCSVEDERIRWYDTPPARSMHLDPTGAFIWLVLDDAIQVYRNPALSRGAPALALETVDGDLAVGRYQSLRFVLRNTGSVAIGRIKASLAGRAAYVVSQDQIDQRTPVKPGDTTLLCLRAKASEGGELPLVLNLEVEDEAGPPAWPSEFDVAVSAHER